MVCRMVGHWFLPRILSSTAAAATGGTGTRTVAKRTSLILSMTSVYLWDEEGISQQELKHTVRDFWRVYRQHQLKPQDKSLIPETGKSNPSDLMTMVMTADEREEEESAIDVDAGSDDWQAIIVKEEFQVYRKLVPGSAHLYQYRIFGTYTDIPAKAFFLVQLDTTFRKLWDKLVIKLEVVDSESKVIRKRNLDYESLIDELDQVADGKRDFDTKNQVVHWIMHYPYPMYCRQYCYVRRAVIDRKRNLLILVSKSTDHPACDNSGNYVRVTSYDSRMVIRPHARLGDNGFDYLLTYSDDPQSSFPSAAYNWMAYSGVPDFVTKLHAAAVRLNSEAVERMKVRKEAEELLKRQRAEELNKENMDRVTGRSHETNRSVNVSKHEAKSDSQTKRTKTSTAKSAVTPASASTSSSVTANTSSSSHSLRVDSGYSLLNAWTSFFSR